MVTGNVLAWIIKQIDPRIKNATVTALQALSKVVRLENQFNALTKVTSINGLSNVVTLSAGSNITLTPSGQNIAIAATTGGLNKIASGTFTHNFYNDGATGTTVDSGTHQLYGWATLAGGNVANAQAGDVILLCPDVGATSNATPRHPVVVMFASSLTNPNVDVCLEGATVVPGTNVPVYNGLVYFTWFHLRP